MNTVLSRFATWPMARPEADEISPMIIETLSRSMRRSALAEAVCGFTECSITSSILRRVAPLTSGVTVAPDGRLVYWIFCVGEPSCFAPRAGASFLQERAIALLILFGFRKGVFTQAFLPRDRGGVLHETANLPLVCACGRDAARADIVNASVHGRRERGVGDDPGDETLPACLPRGVDAAFQ